MGDYMVYYMHAWGDGLRALARLRGVRSTCWGCAGVALHGGSALCNRPVQQASATGVCTMLVLQAYDQASTLSYGRLVQGYGKTHHHHFIKTISVSPRIRSWPGARRKP